jgi:prostaglandin-H2 D-isomerase / glutathione transferase
MSTHKLTYFGLGARGFVTRVCLRKAGKLSEDKRLTFADWAVFEGKKDLPLGQLPALEVDGKLYCQSVPLSCYAAKLAGLYPTTPLEQLEADEVVAILDELWNKGGAVPKDEEKRVAYAKETAPKFLKALEKRLGDKTFFGGAEPMWQDLWVYQYVAMFTSGFFDFIPKDFVEVASPAIAAHAARVKESDLYKHHGTPE